MYTEIEIEGQRILWADTARGFREALKRKMTVELPYELADELGFQFEDVGTEEEIEAARFDPFD